MYGNTEDLVSSPFPPKDTIEEACDDAVEYADDIGTTGFGSVEVRQVITKTVLQYVKHNGEIVKIDHTGQEYSEQDWMENLIFKMGVRY